MTKSRSLSIYLLKPGKDASNALQDDHGLEAQAKAGALPDGASLFLLDSQPRTPWWREYFQIEKPLSQVTKGALIFVPVGDRCFALSFGHVAHNLKDTSYEYDFGLRVTLNCVDPSKLKSTDVLEPSGAKRQRTQLPVDADLTYFDFDRDSTIMKSLTGKVKDAHKHLFRHATGSSNIRVSSAVDPEGLVDLCANLLTLYLDDTYKTAFPEIQNISPVRDPSIVADLNATLIEAVRAQSTAVSLSVPEILSYGDSPFAAFAGAGASKIYDDVFVGRYYEYLSDAGFAQDEIELSDLRKHKLVLTDEDGAPRQQYVIYKCLIFDTAIVGTKQTYHLCDGNWYLVDEDYIERLSAYLDPLCRDSTLSPHVYADEAEYNESVSAVGGDRICLDKTNIAPAGQKQVEPCDIYELADGKAVLHHLKISTLSAQLSHLFNQGANSMRLLRSDSEAMEKMQALVSGALEVGQQPKFLAPLESGAIKVAFGIITHKDKAQKSLNLPLFSRISLMRCMKDLRMMGIEAEFSFIEDQSPKSDGKKKKRKPKGGGAA